ncbi:MAG: hypothetical protein AAFY73_05110 [Pseudomonadota bacterium]
MTTRKEKPSRAVPLDVNGAGPVKTRPNPRGGALLSHVLLGRHAKQIEFQDSAIL